MECCRGCRAMGICGGGCVSNAIRQHGNIYAPNDYSNSFIESAFSGI
jgi:radical SAM protein with 4Fe4S-binding SPASM domain